MSETVDPRVSLTSGDVATRAAAARELAKAGTWDDLELLVERAKTDASPSVRLYTAAAAADIVCRMRGVNGRARLTRQQRELLQTWVKTFDPGINPSLLMLLSAVADQSAVDRLGRMLKDPRNGVRAGAATALRRMSLSVAAADDMLVPMAVDKLLASRKLPADAVLDLVKLVGEAGWLDLEESAVRAAAAVRLPEGVLDEARERLASRRDPAAWEGLWVSDGGDVLETVEEPTVEGWVLVHDGVAHGSDPDAPEIGALALSGDTARLGDARWRMVFVPRVGAPGVYAALQGAGRTWYRQTSKDLVAIVEEIADALTPAPATALAGWLEEVDGVLAARSRAIALWRAGRLDAAREVLDGLIDTKKPRADLFWFLARVHADAGEAALAVRAIDDFLDKAGKRARYRKEAEELRAALAER